MPRRDTAPEGAPCWIELFTADPEKAQIFYGELFGWAVVDPGPDYGGYVNFHLDDVPIAGCMRNDGSQGPDRWNLYLATADAAKTAEAVSANGGTLIVPPMQIMALGTMAVAIDPTGAGIGMWQPAEHKGFGILDEPGTPGWFELHTSDFDAAIEFYSRTFGWDIHPAIDSPEMRYSTFGEGDAALAGIMDASSWLPAGAPSQWSLYFRVADVDAALTRITDLGGSIVEAAVDTPYGRLATAADPGGVQFKLRA
jgi:predicted enzyme related to lactoylglutathione lyase